MWMTQGPRFAQSSGRARGVRPKQHGSFFPFKPGNQKKEIFQDLPLYVRREIVARGRVIFYTDYDFLFNVYLQTLREYSDFERHLRTYYFYLEGAEVEGNG